MLVERVSVPSGCADVLAYGIDDFSCNYEQGTVAADIGALLDGLSGIIPGMRVFALTHPACADPAARMMEYRDIYAENRLEILDPMMAPPKGTIGYDVEIREGEQTRTLLVVLEDRLSDYATAVPVRKDEPDCMFAVNLEHSVSDMRP
jgi:hypothetical protein